MFLEKIDVLKERANVPIPNVINWRKVSNPEVDLTVNINKSSPPPDIVINIIPLWQYRKNSNYTYKMDTPEWIEYQAQFDLGPEYFQSITRRFSTLKTFLYNLIIKMHESILLKYIF